MGQAIPRQQPAVVLRSHFNHLRALLAVALIAVAGLTVAVVILANDSDEAASTSAAPPIGSINYGGSKYVNPSTGYPSVPLSQLQTPPGQAIDGTRYDGGPEEGTADVTPAELPKVTPQTEIKNEAGVAAAIGQSRSGELRGSKASQYGTSQYRLAPSDAELHGSKTDPHGPASLLP